MPKITQTQIVSAVLVVLVLAMAKKFGPRFGIAL